LDRSVVDCVTGIGCETERKITKTAEPLSWDAWSHGRFPEGERKSNRIVYLHLDWVAVHRMDTVYTHE
jgi:hypothetical protein